MVNEAIYGGERHGGIGEDPVPFTKRLVGGDERGTPFVPCADQLEQDGRFSLILGHICEVIEDQQMIFVEFGYRGFERSSRRAT